jgi:4-hydroxyphenylpyruvate dioxygenase-like putative hemolysin
MTTTRDAGALLARIGPRLMQQAWVVDDLAAAKDAMRALGCKKFFELETGDVDYELRGRTVSCALDLAFARSGNLQIELVHPVRGEGIHVEFLASRGSGTHHLGFLVDEMDAAVKAAAVDGFDPVMTGNFGPVRIAYLDTFEAIGVYTELIEDPHGMMAATMPWRDDQPQPS